MSSSKKRDRFVQYDAGDSLPPHPFRFPWWAEFIWRLFAGWQFVLDRLGQRLLGPSQTKLSQIEGRVAQIHIEPYVGKELDNLYIGATDLISSMGSTKAGMLGGTIQLEDGRKFWWMDFQASAFSVTDNTKFFQNLPGRQIRAAVYERDGVLSALALRVEGKDKKEAPTVIYACSAPRYFAPTWKAVLAQQRQIYTYEVIELVTFYCGGVWLLMCLVFAWWNDGSVDPEVSMLLGIWGPWAILIFALLLQTVLKLMGGAAPSMRAIPKILRRSPMATLMLDHRFLTYDMGRLIPFLRQTMGEPE
ncbi:MAG: hypothetical protein LBE24_05850, partial [Methylobacillus sp.]|nr:hypothetical protein [Methylobacillus sp.]